MARKKSTENSFADLVARLNAMSNMTPEEERASLMEAAKQEPKILDDKDISLADIARLAGIKEYTEAPKVSEKAEKLVESITKEEEPKTESDITKAIKESDADDSISANIKRAVTEESKRLDKIAELEAQLAELKSEQKEEQTYDSKSFKEVIAKDIAEYIKNAEESQLVELYNTFSDNEAVYNEEQKSILVKTPETSEIIADAEKAEAPAEDEVIADDSQAKRNMQEPHRGEEKADDEEEKEEEDEDKAGEVPMLDKDFDEGEEVEIEAPAEDKFTNDLDPQKQIITCMHLHVTTNKFNPNPFYNERIRSIFVTPQKDAVSLFDQNGYDLTKLEQLYAVANGYDLTKHRNEQHITLRQDWFNDVEPDDGPHINHAYMFERK